MAIPVTRTKVIIPRERADILHRQRLVDLLVDLLDYKLLIIAAPAGYGKTSLLVDFAHRVQLPVCWYSLDPLDRDPQRFIAHLIAAIAQRFPSFGSQSLSMLETASQTDLDMDDLVTALVNDAYENIQEHFILVIDDYHLVNETAEIDYFVSRFIQDVDENLHLILASRSLLSLPDLPLMVARSQVGGLSFEELAFQPEEIQSLVLQNYHLTIPTSTAEELARETEGWITGLLLSAETMWQDMIDRVRVARVSGIGLYDYLAQQVLDQQPPEIRDFLLRTSLLEEFDISLCKAVFGEDKDWRSIFNTVLQSNLFVLSVGDDGTWIRYHHLFRDFLQARIEQERPEEKQKILTRLAQVYVEQQEWDKAFDIYHRQLDWPAIADLLEQAGPLLIKSGRLGVLSHWLDVLPPEYLISNPNLLSLRGAVAISRGQIESGIDLLNQAEALQRASGEKTHLAITLTRRAVGHRFLGNYSEAIRDAQAALALIENDPNMLYARGEAYRSIGATLFYQGQPHEAVTNLNQAHQAYSLIKDHQNVAMVVMELGIANLSLGRYPQALDNFQQALNYWNRVKNTVNQANVLNNLGVLHHLLGDYEQAFHCYKQALALARQNGDHRMEAYVLCGTGDLYADLGIPESALDAYDQARQVAQRIDYRFLLLYTHLAAATQHGALQRITQAHQALETAERSFLKTSSFYESGLHALAAGRLALLEKDYAKAVEHLRRCVDLFAEGGQQVELSRAYFYLASACEGAGNCRAALQELEQAFRQASSVKSAHILVPAGREHRTFLERMKGDPQLGEKVTGLLQRVACFEESIPTIRKRLRPHTAAVPFAPPQLTIRALGRTQVEIDGRPVTAPEWLNQRRVREFLFYLLASAEGLTKEEIGLTFWPDSSPAQLKLQFKNTIYRLRHALGPDVIYFDEDRYWFNRNLDYQYDVEMFLDGLSQARAAASTVEKIKAYSTAIELYRGPFFPEADGTWAWTEREHLREAFFNACLDLASLQLESRQYNEALENCHRVLNEDPCLEEAHRLAMKIYAAQGNRAAITRQFEYCRQILHQEINVPPSPQTETLYRMLCR